MNDQKADIMRAVCVRLSEFDAWVSRALPGVTCSVYPKLEDRMDDLRFYDEEVTPAFVGQLLDVEDAARRYMDGHEDETRLISSLAAIDESKP